MPQRPFWRSCLPWANSPAPTNWQPLPESRPRKNNPELFKAAPALQAGLWVLAKKPSHESQSKMSIIGAAMRLLLHLIFGV
jgi:hypothetical protein